VIAESSGMMRQLFAETLAQRGLVVVGQTGTATELPGVVDVTEPDVVLADPRLPPNQRDDGLTAAEEIHCRHPHVGLLILSHDADAAHALRLLELAPRGVGYLVKERVRDIGRLVEAINGVAAGEVIVDPELVRRLMVRPRVDDPLRRLAEGEHQLLALMAEGRSNSAIARELHYSLKTVEKMITSLLRKLGLPGRTSAEGGEMNLRVMAVLTYLRGLSQVRS
jgi:DNA-binding NarL/FixJ family response regulator